MILSTRLKQEKEGKQFNNNQEEVLSYCVFVKQGHRVMICGVPYFQDMTQRYDFLLPHIPLMRDDLTFSVGDKQI